MTPTHPPPTPTISKTETVAPSKEDTPRGVSIILFRNGLFAVSQRLSVNQHAGLWQFAGGHVEPDESPLAAAQRELREETGLDLWTERFIPLGITGKLKGYKGEEYIGHRYGVILTADEQPQRSEPDKATEWTWVTAQDLVRIPMLQATKEYALLMTLDHFAPLRDRLAFVEKDLRIAHEGLDERDRLRDRLAKMEAASSAWAQSGVVMADADKLEELIKLKMERPGVTREEALAWAVEMRRLYSATPPVNGVTPKITQVMDVLAETFAQYAKGNIYMEDMAVKFVEAKGELSYIDKQTTALREENGRQAQLLTAHGTIEDHLALKADRDALRLRVEELEKDVQSLIAVGAAQTSQAMDDEATITALETDKRRVCEIIKAIRHERQNIINDGLSPENHAFACGNLSACDRIDAALAATERDGGTK